jgi:choline dehydrogenase-like flavoprotein
MDKILIVGSGASGVHFALSVLKKGYDVTMIDVGYEKPDIANPEDNWMDLKNQLNDPAGYFLGQNFERVTYPDNEGEYYGFPPSKNYVFQSPLGFKFQSRGFAPTFSFARGGLAEAWTGGVYPFNDYELGNYPFSYNKLMPYYTEVARRIGIMGADDDLAKFFPLHDHIMEPLDLDDHSRLILSEYEKHKHYLNAKFKCYLGRSRVAVLSNDKHKRKSCSYCGRCIWGCPSESFYTPLITLRECLEYTNFKYIPNMFVDHFKYTSGGHITSVVAESQITKEYIEFPVEKLVLAAGTLSSSKIFIDSVYKNTGEIIKLYGLMDNRQILMPFINMKLIGTKYNPESYQYHQVSLGIEQERPEEYIHTQITTLKTAMIHPIIQNMLFDLKTSLFAFRNVHAALGVASASFHDYRRKDNYLTLQANKELPYTKLVINYTPPVNEEVKIKQVIRIITKTLRKLGCYVPSATNHVRPMGANIHYAGTIPMSPEGGRMTASEYCQSNDFINLYLVDGTTFPWLPAKNLTFTMMANALRVADTAF